MSLRTSLRVFLVPALAGLVPAFVPAATAQSVSPNFSYTRNANGTPVISDEGFAKPAPAPERIARVTTVSQRGDRFESLIDRHAQAAGLNPVLVRAVIEAESAFNPRAVSRVGAMGLMQLMPGTARDLGVNDPFDPNENIRGGTTYLRSLLDRFNNNVELALAAYNAGPAAVERYDGIPPYRETRNYVNKITGVKAIKNGSLTIYEVIEVTPDGREVRRFTDKKPDEQHSVVAFRAR